MTFFVTKGGAGRAGPTPHRYIHPCQGDVAYLPICGPPLILPPPSAVKRWGPPKRQGLGRHARRNRPP